MVGIGLHGGGVLAPVLPEEDVHHDAVHRAAHIPGFQQLRHSLRDQLNRVDGTAPAVTPSIYLEDEIWPSLWLRCSPSLRTRSSRVVDVI